MIYLLRDLIIGILFTHKFSEMRQLFGWEIAGDTLKIGSWILAYVMLGKAMVKLFILTEILFTLSYIGLCWVFIYQMGFVGVAVAYTINYAVYWATVFYIVKRSIKRR
jgi:PST family polysaccharide transporter